MDLSQLSLFFIILLKTAVALDPLIRTERKGATEFVNKPTLRHIEPSRRSVSPLRSSKRRH